MAEEQEKKPAAPRRRAPAKDKPAEAAAPAAKPKRRSAAPAAPASAAEPARPEAKPVSRPKTPAARSGKTVTVTQIGSPIGRRDYQRATLKGLGLDKLHRTRVLEDTPAVRGMIERVKHLLRLDSAG